MGGAKESPADGGFLSRANGGVAARVPGAAMGERESERERDGAMIDNRELQQRLSSQLDFEQGQGHQGQVNFNKNSNPVVGSNRNLA